MGINIEQSKGKVIYAQKFEFKLILFLKIKIKFDYKKEIVNLQNENLTPIFGC